MLRLYDQVRSIDPRTGTIELMIEELVEAQMSAFARMHLTGREIRNIIVVDDYLSLAMDSQNLLADHEDLRFGFFDTAIFEQIMDRIRTHDRHEIATYLNIADEKIPLLQIAAVMTRTISRIMGAEMIWAPGVCLCDGIVYEYAERHANMRPGHDFEQDIVACAHGISRRYQGSRVLSAELEKMSLKIFDAVRRGAGLGHRERLLLQIAAILCDCGRYISLVNAGESSYNIILSTEIIGLSHLEREIVANVARYSYMPFVYYEQQAEATDIDRDSYLVIARLSAILKAASGIIRLETDKFTDAVVRADDEELVITVAPTVDVTLESGLFRARAAFFEEIYGLKPVIRRRRK